MLAEMMDPDLEVAVEGLRDLGISRLDLKNHVFDRAIDGLDDERRERLAVLLQRTGASVYCFSSTLGHRNISHVSERELRGELERGIANMIETARLVRPDKVRFLSCLYDEREAYSDAT